MHDAGCVSRNEGARDLDRKVEYLSEFWWPGAQVLSQRDTINKFRNKETRGISLDNFVNRQDVRMVERGGRFRFLNEALHAPLIGGHIGRLGSRQDMVVYQQYVDDIVENVKKALVTVDPTPYFVKYGNNVWAAVKEYQAAQIASAAGPVIKKYTGVLAAADVYTASTTFIILESLRLDLGLDSQVHP